MKKLLVWLLTTFFAATISSTEAQEPVKIPRIGLMTATGDSKTPGPQVEAFRQGLKELGYIEGKNCVVEYRYELYGEGHRELVAELLKLKIDVLVVGSLPAIRAAKAATKTVPIVIVTVQDPVASGYIDSLARPGGNITGLTRLTLAPELNGKKLEILKEVTPRTSRVAVFVSSNVGDFSHVSKKEVELAAAALRLKIHYLDVLTPADFENAFKEAIMGRADGALMEVGGPVAIPNRKKTAELAVKSRLPVMYRRTQDVEAGGLMTYGVNIADLDRRAATYVDKILKGTKPADLPVVQPTRFEFVINLKAAKQIGVTIPPNVLARATKIIR